MSEHCQIDQQSDPEDWGFDDSGKCHHQMIQYDKITLRDYIRALQSEFFIKIYFKSWKAQKEEILLLECEKQI